MRASGVLMGISSIPSEYGIGCFSKEAYDFVDILEKAGQRYWQILPLGPTGYGDSPYQSCSTYAGNPYFIDLEELIKEGLLTKEECDSCNWGEDPVYVDYEKIYNYRFPLLHKAYERADLQKDQEYQVFAKRVSDLAEGLCPLYGDQKQPGGQELAGLAQGASGQKFRICEEGGEGA